MSDKPEVLFSSVIGFRDFGERGISVMLGGIKNHPRLGSQREVTTSRVERLEYDRDMIVVIETRNTMYIRDDGR